MQEQKNNLLIPASILLAGFIIAGGIYFSNKDQNDKTVTDASVNSANVSVNTISSSDHIRGNPDAPIAILEFSDTECPYCKVFQSTMQSVMNIYGKDGKVSWVYRHFPIDSLHSKSRKEAEAVECVGELGGSTGFWKMLDMVYANTPSNNGLDAAKLPVFAKDIGVDVDKFNECLSSGKYANVVEADLQDAVKAGASGTPFSIIILKDELSDDKEKALQDYIVKAGLAQNISISSSKKEIVLNGALSLDMMKSVLDILVK